MNHPKPVSNTHIHVVRVRLSNGSMMRKVLPLRSSSAVTAYARLEKFVRGKGDLWNQFFKPNQLPDHKAFASKV
ncbi:hypothetical protein GGC63_006200 [Paenibacillus sp. OAS669]|nr:hypothetical protein [Paenibacillus sp. OAS669]